MANGTVHICKKVVAVIFEGICGAIWPPIANIIEQTFQQTFVFTYSIKFGHHTAHGCVHALRHADEDMPRDGAVVAHLYHTDVPLLFELLSMERYLIPDSETCCTPQMAP